MFVLYPQASRAIKKVVRCEPGLPFKGGSLEPGAWSPYGTQMNRGGVLFPRRGTLPSAGRSPRGQAKFAVGLREGKRRWGDKGPCLCEGHVHTHRHTFSQAGMHYHIPTGAPAWNTDLQACQGKYVWGVHILACTHMHTHAQLLHLHATSKCTHSWAHMGICTKFACSGYIC